MEVRNTQGLVSSMVRTVPIGPPTLLGGEIQSQELSGTVFLNASVVVPEGQVLRIAAGTRMVFWTQDQDNNNVGDIGLDIQGQIEINGTAEAPVVFVPADPSFGPGAWAGVRIRSAGQDQINHAIFALADRALEVEANDVGINDTTFARSLRDGLVVQNAWSARASAVS